MSKVHAMWLKKAEEAESDETREFCLHQAEQSDPQRIEKRKAEKLRLATESAKRRRLREEEEVQRMENELVTEEQRIEMKIARLRRNIDDNLEARRDAPGENAIDIKHLFRLSSMLAKTPWMQILYPWITLSSNRPTHRIYTRSMKTICLTTTLHNRGEVLDLMDKLQNKRGFLELHMIQELIWEQNIMPFFDVEPEEEKYIANISRRSSDNAPSPRPSLELVMALIASLFGHWPALAWIVWTRESDTGKRYHIRVRGLKGDCVVINRGKLSKRVQLGRMQPTERCKIPTRDWIGLDHRPYDGQMRFSNSIKCDDPEALAKDAIYGTDTTRQYTYYKTFKVEGEIGRAHV